MTRRETMVFYASWLDAVRALPKAMQGDVLLSILEYGIEGKTVCKQGSVAAAMLTMVKPIIDANNKRYEGGKKGAEYGSLGGRPRKNPSETPQKPLDNPSETPQKPPYVDVYDNTSSTTTEDTHAREIECFPIDEDSGKEKSCAKKESLPAGTMIAADMIAEALSNDVEWVESVALHFGREEGFVREQIAKFGDHVALSEQSKEIVDAKRHFVNWIRKIEINERTIRRPTYGQHQQNLDAVRRAVAEGLAVAATPQDWE